MNTISRLVARKHLRQIYSSWHCCALKDSEIAQEDKERGLRVGQLCDDCENMIDAHLSDMADESKARK